MTTAFETPQDQEGHKVLEVLSAAGPRGASHEDFVEAGLARSYVAGLRRLVDERGLDVRIDFTTGAARWAIRPGSSFEQHAA
jgi:hypothetical protein